MIKYKICRILCIFYERFFPIVLVEKKIFSAFFTKMSNFCFDYEKKHDILLESEHEVKNDRELYEKMQRYLRS